MEKKTVLTEIIEKLLADSAFLNGENDAPIDRAVGSYLKTIAEDLKENYLAKEQEQIFEAFVAGDERGTGNIPFNCEQYYDQTYGELDADDGKYVSVIKKEKKVVCVHKHEDGLTVGKAVEILNIHQQWRIGEIEEMPYPPKVITEAIGLLLAEFAKLSKVKSKKIDRSKCLHDKVFWHNGLGWRCKLCGAQGKVSQ